MMKQLRENTKIILWIVVISFVITIFAVWGLDLQGGGGRRGGQSSVLGEVNGTPITRHQYQAVSEQLSAQMRKASPNGQLSYTQQELIQEQAWENIVTSILTDQEIKKLGIQVTDEEVVTYLMTSPPPEIQQYFLDENGKFDFSAYQQALNNPEADWSAVEQLARQRIPMIKLNSYLVSQVHVSPDEVREVFDEENTSITAEYVSFPLADENVTDYAPTDEQIQSYYEEHSDDFRRGERAVVEYVRIPIEPTAADLDGLMFTINTLRENVAAGEDFAEMARVYSQAPTASVGGETGFIKAAQRPRQVMTQAAIMNVGQVSEPIQTKDGVYLVQLLDKKQEDDETEFNLREIFLELTAGRETLDSLTALARGVQETAVEQSLAKAAADSGLTVETSEPFQRDFPIPGLGFVPSINRFAFNNKPNVISNVISDDKNYYVARVVEKMPSSIRPLEEVTTIIVERLKHDRQQSMALRKAEAFVRKLSNPKVNFQKAADDYGYVIHRPEPFRYVDPVDDIPPRSPFAYAALRIQEGVHSPPVETNGAYIVFRVLERTPFDEEEYQSRETAITERLRQEKVREYISYWYEQLKEKANIVDNRGSV
jgi:peptidyl-prolyl cis-trans isomerase D